MNITVYGDSILKGIRLEEGTYKIDRQWEKQLAAEHGLVIRNSARFGNTLAKAMELIRRDSEKTAEKDGVAVLELGGNDCDYDWAAISADPDRRIDCKTPPALFVRLYREALGLIRRGGRRPVALNLIPIHSGRYLRFICRNGLSRENILHWLGDVDAISRWQEKYSRMIEKIAAEEGVELIDVRGAFLRDSHSAEELLCSDGIHPSRLGQKLIFDTLSSAFV